MTFNQETKVKATTVATVVDKITEVFSLTDIDFDTALAALRVVETSIYAQRDQYTRACLGTVSGTVGKTQPY